MVTNQWVMEMLKEAAWVVPKKARGTKNKWSGMDVEASSGGANQGHANIGILRAQSHIGDSNIHIHLPNQNEKSFDDQGGSITPQERPSQRGDMWTIPRIS
ncbi:hypothetical protein QJS10_CPB21g01096 [Acorus calamus]|uniref:Uncharacterized protein n=1 Tax=Acorus calamus TaxID=4465 RepID=A0AAV9C3W0_ACOCL|nr:hypothetical protein QJS10_CPB21g01096 [Acorus calamus]